MPTIALIQNGAEVARQRYADVYGDFVRACEELSSANRGLTFTLQVFPDDAVRFLLRGISPDEFSCVIFASNALLSNEVCQAVATFRQQLEEYIRAGGGLLVLHQFRPSLDGVLPADICPRLVERQGGGPVQAFADLPNDITLRYPNCALLDGLKDDVYGSGLKRLYWESLERRSMPEKLRPILSAGAAGGPEVLLARTVSGIRERVIVSTLPLDWLGQVELLANAIRYVALGEPRRLLWLPTSLGPRTDFVLRWLYSDGASAVSTMAGSDAMSEADEWLFRQVDVCIVPPDEFHAVCDREVIRAFVKRGGTLITADLMPAQAATEVSAIIGAGQRGLSRRLYAELGANSDWMSFDNAFHLRNIVGALAMFHRKQLDDSALAIPPEAVAHLVEPIEHRLQQDEHRQDLSSSIALGEVLCHLVRTPRGDASLFEWMDKPQPPAEQDVRLQIRALRSHWECKPDAEFVATAVQFLKGRASSPGSVAPVARLLGTTAMLNDAGLLIGNADAFKHFAQALVRELDQRPLDPEVGWNSLEATADVTRGLVAVIDHLQDSDTQEKLALAPHVAGAATVLRRAMRRFDSRTTSAAWLAQLARLVQALILVDERFPVGLRRLASLEWPAEGPASAVTSIAEDSLMGDLAVQVKELRENERELQEELRNKDDKLQEQRLAARVGRTFATLGGTLVLAGLFALLLLAFPPKLEWDWIKNVGIGVSILVIVLGLYFTLLKRWNLLTQWGDRIRDMLTQISDILRKVADIKTDRLTPGSSSS